MIAMRDARRQFFDDITEYACSHHVPLLRRRKLATLEQTVDLIRSDYTYQIATFYFTVEEQGLANENRIKQFIDRHERARRLILTDPKKRELLNLKEDRLTNAEFKIGHIDEIADAISRSGEPRRLQLNISSFSRFLTTLMSPTSCENAVLALRDACLITCQNLAASVRIDDASTLVFYYRKHLTDVLTALRGR